MNGAAPRAARIGMQALSPAGARGSRDVATRDSAWRSGHARFVVEAPSSVGRKRVGRGDGIRFVGCMACGAPLLAFALLEEGRHPVVLVLAVEEDGLGDLFDDEARVLTSAGRGVQGDLRQAH